MSKNKNSEKRTQEKRLIKCKKFIKRFKNDASNIVFCDEKFFTLSRVYNNHNDRVWRRRNDENRKNLITRCQKAKGVMVWAAISSFMKSPLIFVEVGVKMNSNNYKKLLSREFLPWYHSKFGKKKFTFMQDSAPAHRSKIVQEWCSAKF